MIACMIGWLVDLWYNVGVFIVFISIIKMRWQCEITIPGKML